MFLRVADLQRKVLGPKASDVGITLYHIGSLYVSQKNYPKALEYAREELQVFLAAEGKNGKHVPTTQSNIGWLLDNIGFEAQKREEWNAARKAYAEALQTKIELYGETSWKTQGIRQSLRYVDQLEKMSPADRQKVADADKLFWEARNIGPDKPHDAIVPAEKALAIYDRLFGEEHFKTLSALFQVSYLYKEMGDFTRARPIYVRLPDLSKKVNHGINLDYYTSLHNLGDLLLETGETQRAEIVFQQALEAAKELFGEQDESYATTLNSLGVVNNELGRLAQAESYYRKALEVRKQDVGQFDVKYAHSLLNLGFFYVTGLQDYGKAEPLLRQAVEIYKNRLGTKHPDYSRGIDFLASLYTHQERYDEAEALYREALAIREKTYGMQHRQCAITVHNMALMFLVKGDFAKAEPLLLQTLDIDKNTVGEDHLAAALSMISLADLYEATGRYLEAERWEEKALAIRKKKLGEQHLEYADSLSRVGVLKALRGNPSSGLPLAVEALHLVRRRFDQDAVSQSERGQFALRKMVWNAVDRYLFVSRMAKAPADEVYAEVLNWKGIVGARQQQMRRVLRELQAGGNVDVAALARELSETSSTLASLSQATNSNDPERPFRVKELSDRVEAIQKQLVAASAAYRQAQNQERRTVDDIRRVLGDDTVLIDFLSYRHFDTDLAQDAKPGQTAETQRELQQTSLFAFIVRADRPVERVELGLTGQIETAISAWRKRFGDTGAVRTDPGTELRRLVWQPLAAHLDGTATVLISPNALVAPMPWAALPGSQPGRYLIDEYAIALAPIPSLMPDLLSERARQNSDSAPPMLIVGDVDFDSSGADASNHARPLASTADFGIVRGSQAYKWTALPGTRDELVMIRQSYENRFGAHEPVALTQSRATKKAVADFAQQCKYLHFSTHGFFSAPKPSTASRGGEGGSDSSKTASLLSKSDTGLALDPGLLSGLVLAGANQPPQGGREDGILTALEVETMDLSRVELATLSACETGLGDTAGGEGLLGLQRAFQTAGAKTVVASLWKVPDKATQLLMSRFYDNMWQKKMSKLAALREAQRWLLHEALKEPGRVRGLDLAAEAEPRKPADGSNLLPPFYWAAFVLSGDWR